MNHAEFIRHFDQFMEFQGIEDYRERCYLVCPITEEGKTYLSCDDMMRLLFLPKPRKMDYSGVLRLFTWKEGYYPLWIRVSEVDGEIVLRTSLRMRKAGARDDKRFYPFEKEEYRA